MPFEPTELSHAPSCRRAGTFYDAFDDDPIVLGIDDRHYDRSISIATTDAIYLDRSLAIH